ncbi:MAG: DUF1707 domain-containing protein [Thermoleophilia bacterium]
MEQGGPPGPPVRASDSERDAAVRALTEAAAEGRITLEELGDRTSRALEAVSRDELAELTADLPAASPGPPRSGTRWVLGVLGGGDRAGRWRIAPRCTVVNVMGGADLDLRQATVEAPETSIRVFSLMGGSTIVVPEGVEVDAGGFAFLGGNDVRLDGPLPQPGAPRLRIRAWSLMGGTDVTTVPGPRRLHGRHGHGPPPPPPAPPPPPTH